MNSLSYEKRDRAATAINFWLLPTQGLYNVAPIDGIWLDMNEVSNYCSGDVCVDPGELSQT